MNFVVGLICVMYIIIAVTLVTLILMQKKRSAGFTSGGGALSSDQTYLGKNKGRTLEGTLERFTKIGIVVFIVLTALTWFINV